MIKIEFPEPTDDQWQAWRAKCVAARQALNELVAAGGTADITDLYKEMAAVYKSLGSPFHGKCVYCESDIGVNHPGDIEHWRPKNRVTDNEGRPITIATAEGPQPHPGYYWLAYEWSNLLFACEDCNRPSKAKTPGIRIGKWDQFPVREFRATRDGEESREEPILINPVEDDPSDHLEIDEMGVVIPKTDRGQACTEIFGLNSREPLVNARKEFIKNTLNKVELASAAAARGDEARLRDLMSDLAKIKAGETPFAAAGRGVLPQVKERLERFVGDI